MNTFTQKLFLFLMLLGMSFTQATAALNVVSTSPANYEEDVLIHAPIIITYDAPFTIANMGSIIVNGVPVDPSWVSISGNDLIIQSVGLLKDFTYLVNIKPGALNELDGTPSTENFTFTFYTEKDKPVLFSDRYSIYYESLAGEAITQTAILKGEYIVPPTILDVQVEIVGDDAAQFSAQQLTVADTKRLILTGESLGITYAPTVGGVHKAKAVVTIKLSSQLAPLVVEIDLEGVSAVVTGIEEGGYAKEVVKEEIYTLSGVRVSEATANGIYVKKSFYDDGSTSTEKFAVR